MSNAKTTKCHHPEWPSGYIARNEDSHSEVKHYQPIHQSDVQALLGLTYEQFEVFKAEAFAKDKTQPEFWKARSL